MSTVRKSRTQKLAEQLLRDRTDRAARKTPRTGNATKAERIEFDPFSITRWRVIAGGNPGYLVKTPMRRGPVGWFITCGHCGAEFESKGRKNCPSCMKLPAEERRDKPAPSERHCQAPGCNAAIPRRRRANAKYCTDECAKAAENARGYQGSAHAKFRGDTREFLQQKQGPKNVFIGARDFPINVIAGHRFSKAPKLDPVLQREVLATECAPRRGRRRP
jgi:hypothetical protein